MSENLLDATRRYTEAHASANGVTSTPIHGLTLIRETSSSELQYAINKPLIALVLQGGKRVTMGSETLELTADVPTVSQITKATVAAPYFSIIIDLDPTVIDGLVCEMRAEPLAANVPIRVDPTDAEVGDAVLRLIRLLDRPDSLPILQTQLIRELHFWLLSGRHGAAIRSLGVAESHAQRVARAVTLIRKNYSKPLRIERLAEAASMSPASFHEHFKAVTSLTPLQFQKQLRLIEARRMMLSDGAIISNACYAVGYESIPHFTREYGRFFGESPARDMKAAKARVQLEA